MSKYGIAHSHASIFKRIMVLLLAHHQMLCYCSLANHDSRTKNKGLASQDYSSIVIVFVDKLECDGRN